MTSRSLPDLAQAAHCRAECVTDISRDIADLGVKGSAWVMELVLRSSLNAPAGICGEVTHAANGNL